MVRYLCLFILLMIGFNSEAAEVPEALEKWKGWVTYEQEYRTCPVINGTSFAQKENYLCAWPGRLNLVIDDTQASFSQYWELLDKGLVPLPGNLEYWPQEVTVNGNKVVVLEKHNRPYIELTKGKHNIQGQIFWSKRPEALSIPQEVALLSLIINGEKQAFSRVKQGSLWLGSAAKTQIKEKDYLKLWVNRLVQDNHPMTMAVEIEMEVSGSAREQQLTQFLPEQYQLMSIRSELNARVDSQGYLWVQLKPGEFRLRLEFKLHHYPEVLSFSQSGEYWPKQELWAFASNDRLRSTQIEGAAAIDSKQGLVNEWFQYPHYVMNRKDNFNIVQRHRGMSHNFDSLILKRDMWLGFNGDKYYFQDSIYGNKSKDWRISTIENYRLTQLSNHGKERLITYDTQQRTGAEIRTPDIQILAGGEVKVEDMQHASGWDINFAKTNVNLNVPPGRKLISVAGADSSYGDWVNQWELIDLFYLMVILALVYRIFGLLAAGIALLALLLGYHEPGMPLLLWGNLIFAVSLAKKINRESVKKWINTYQWISLGLLLLSLLPFLAQQVRLTLYPQLELNHSLNASNEVLYDSFSDEASQQIVADRAPQALMESQPAPEPVMKLRSRGEKITVTGSRMKRTEIDSSYQPGAVIQAGQGVPQWHWQKASYYWSGNVAGDALVKLFILSEVQVKIWRILLIVLSVFWLLVIFKQHLRDTSFSGWLSKASAEGKNTAVMIGMISLLGLFNSPLAEANTYPDQKLLQELQNRLYPQPECQQDCVTLSQAKLTVNEYQLVLQLNYHASTKIAGLLPDSQDWHIESITHAGTPVRTVWKNHVGRWLSLNKGRSQVVIKAKLKHKSDIKLIFPERPKLIAHQVSGWEVSGINQQRLINNVLQFNKLVAAPDEKAPLSLSEVEDKLDIPAREQSIAGLFQMERFFRFGTQWELTTQVIRHAPQTGAITTKIPLLSFEKPLSLTDNIRDGMMQIALSTNEYSKQWNSSLASASRFELVASDNPAISEVWKILVFPNWNIQIGGVPAVMPETFDRKDFWVYEYYPRANEKLSFQITQPIAVEGESVAITSVEQQFNLGKRKLTNQLDIHYRATRADQIQIQLGQSELQQLKHDGELVNLGQVEGHLSIPVKPGEHHLSLVLGIKQPVEFLSQLSGPDIGLPYSNLSSQVRVPENRWLLAVSGPGYGPAVIYWGELIFFLLLAVGLSRLSFSPLNYWQWLLLGLGMSTFSWPAMGLVSAWLLISEWRRQRRELVTIKPLASWAILLSSVIAVLTLVAAVPFGLLQTPDMGVVGNASYNQLLYWFLDHGENSLGDINIYTAPIWVYKGLMLLWATWLSFSLVRWIGWIWQDLSGAQFIQPREKQKG